jgi:teichoic acid transport system permease protein
MTPTNNSLEEQIKVFEPHRASLPPMKNYLKEFWARREFAFELARFTDKAEYLDAKLGRVWMILNPLLLALVYYLLVSVIRGGSTVQKQGLTTLTHILIGLFTFYFAQNCISAGALSITAGGRLILNQAFPRALLPLSSSIQAFQQFLPEIPVYIVVVIAAKFFYPKTHVPGLTWNFLWIPFFIICVGLTGFGMSLGFATMNVYFRDTSKFLAYLTRIWLYLSPVLWLPETLHGWHYKLLLINPLGPVLAATSDLWVNGKAPNHIEIIGSAFWAIFSIAACGYFFVSRERDFAVRI